MDVSTNVDLTNNDLHKNQNTLTYVVQSWFSQKLIIIKIFIKHSHAYNFNNHRQLMFEIA